MRKKESHHISQYKVGVTPMRAGKKKSILKL